MSGTTRREAPRAQEPGRLPSNISWYQHSMGRKNASETLIAIVDAFHRQRTWRQDELAEHLGIEPRTIRIACYELMRTGRFPLDRTEERPHVYWSLPKHWVPGGIAIPESDLQELTRLLAHAPRSAFRDRLLALVLASAPPKI